MDKTFKNLKEGGKLALRGKELTEDKFVVLPKFLNKQVVPPFAGSVYFGEPFKVPDSDHFSISKPASRDDIQHRLLTQFVKESLDATVQPERALSSPATPVLDKANLVSASESVGPVKIPPIPKRRDLGELLVGICSLDPLVAIPAAQELAVCKDATMAIVDRPNRSNERVPLAAARIALAGREDAADELANRVLRANDDWQRAVAASFDLDVSHRALCANRLGAALDKGGRDRTRAILWALGSLGAVEWAYSVRSFIHDLGPRPSQSIASTDDLRDYIGYALGGLLDMYCLASNSNDARHVSEALRDTIKLDEKYSTNGYGVFTTRLALGYCSGTHIDDLISKWAADQSARVRSIAADALGDIRAQRSIVRLEQLLGDVDDRVRSAASQALGALETTEALEALKRSAPGSDGLSFLLHLVTDDEYFEEQASSWLAQPSFFRWCAIRAVGLKRVSEFAPQLREFLNSDNELERGCALLALARIGDAKDSARILSGVHESSDSFEQVMAMLALVIIDPDMYNTIEVKLRQSLADFSYAFWQPARRDIITVLESIGVNDARALAQAWRPFYAGAGVTPLT